jgi:hypothetical protein
MKQTPTQNLLPLWEEPVNPSNARKNRGRARGLVLRWSDFNSGKRAPYSARDEAASAPTLPQFFLVRLGFTDPSQSGKGFWSCSNLRARRPTAQQGELKMRPHWLLRQLSVHWLSLMRSRILCPGRLIAETETHLESLKTRYANKHSECGRLLAHIRSDDDLSQRSLSAHTFGLIGYRRGLKQLEHLTRKLCKELSRLEEFGTPERSLLSSVVFAIARMDTEQSHAFLATLLSTSNDYRVRADVMEAMAFEKDTFDIELVVPFLSTESHTIELMYAEPMSALYAIMFHPSEARKRRGLATLIAPCLRHEIAHVRYFAAQALAYSRSNRRLIEQQQNDPDPHVLEAIRSALDSLQ